MFRGKNYKESTKLIDKSAQYEPAEAFELVTKTAKAKFDETVELHVKLGVDSRHADQQVRGAIVLPNGTGKSVKVLVFCKPEREEAKEIKREYTEAKPPRAPKGYILVETKSTKYGYLYFKYVLEPPKRTRKRTTRAERS